MAPLNEYLAPYVTFRAVQYDGSRESAAAIAAAFPGKLAWSVDRDGVLLALASKVVGPAALNELEPGSWLVEVDRYLGVFAIYGDPHFTVIYSARPRRENA